jgi:cytochrome c-type biogenesis protein CcmE
MKRYGKFAALIAVVVGTLVWLASAGMNETKTYYKTISELGQMGDSAYGKRLRVGGDVEEGSIQRAGGLVHFVITQDNRKLRITYSGTDPLPDTFRGGKLERDGTFRAAKIQAKCASKYEAKPGMKPGDPAPNLNPAKSAI